MTEEKQDSKDEGELTPTKLINQYKWIVSFCAVVLIVALVGSTIGGAYNTIIQKDVTVEQMQGNVQTALERRADLIPNYVSTVSGSAQFEQSTLVQVIAMRSQATQIKENVKGARTVEEIQASQDELGAVIGRLLMLTEQYPTLKTTDQFKELEAQLTATENQINMERNNYNTAVMDYKMTVRSFPMNYLAKWFGYSPDKWDMFTAAPQKQEVPVVTFPTYNSVIVTSR
jgi:LemA protein